MSNQIKCALPKEFEGKTWHQIAEQLNVPYLALYSEFNRNGKDLVKAYEKIKARKPKDVSVIDESGKKIRFETINAFCAFLGIKYPKYADLTHKGMTWQDMYANRLELTKQSSPRFVSSDGRVFETDKDFLQFLDISPYLFNLLQERFGQTPEQLYQMKVNNKVIPGKGVYPAISSDVVHIASDMQFYSWRALCTFLEIPFHYYSIMMDMGMSHKEIFNKIVQGDPERYSAKIVEMKERVRAEQDRLKSEQDRKEAEKTERMKQRAVRELELKKAKLKQAGQKTSVIVLSNGVTFPNIKTFRDFLGLTADEHKDMLRSGRYTNDSLYSLRLERGHLRSEAKLTAQKYPLSPIILSGIKVFNNWMEMIEHLNMPVEAYIAQRDFGRTDEEIYYEKSTV